MKTPERAYTSQAAVSHPAPEEKHLLDYLRVIYKRRWIAIPAFLVVFVIGSVNALRETPIFQGRVQLLIEQESPSVTTLDQMFQSSGDTWYNDDFYQTQYRILQSRSLAKRTIDMLGLWDAPKLGSGPEEKAQISVTGLVASGVQLTVSLVKKPFAPDEPSAPAPDRAAGETTAQSGRIDEFLGGVSVVPVRNSRIVEIRYTSSDPKFAAVAANAVAKAYIQQNTELRFNTSKDTSDWLAGRLVEQRRAVEASDTALQAYRERNGAVSIADSASNIVVARLTDLNSALTKAKTERINKEAIYNQLKSAESTGVIDTFPKILANEYVPARRDRARRLPSRRACPVRGPESRRCPRARAQVPLHGAPLAVAARDASSGGLRGVHAEAEDAPLGRPHREHEESLWRRARRRLRLAEESAARPRRGELDRRPRRDHQTAPDDCRRRDGHGGRRAHHGPAAPVGVHRHGRRSPRRGCDMCAHHRPRSAQGAVLEDGG
jgi:uncharacterized protein involved in exopolysaccharide biosynthesis